ncbi:c-type cytochrome [Thermithiobacillus plumbiphilus]|uniref:C-type cytochrome n=1 Tax=Thermithiobacillus plumbiphilus TaxID=1729899 RepID=A0ABU9DA07_9PROT
MTQLKWYPALAVISASLVLLGCQQQSGEGQQNTEQQANASRPAPAPEQQDLTPAEAPSGGSAEKYFQPPREIPNDEFGKVVRQGELIFTNTPTYAKGYSGNALSCVNCHIDKGRLANSAPLWAAYVAYPAYRSKNKHVNTIQERMQGCFRFSMNGTPPAADSPEMTALVTYAYWMAQGAPTGEKKMAGRGYPVLKKPASVNRERGAKIFASSCAVCHGADGQGQSVNGTTVFPPLWGPQSFNWGAGMHRVNTAAGFIKANMPLGQGNTLSDQDAWDVAAYVMDQPRPQDPRFKGDTAATDKEYHDHFCYYGEAGALPRQAKK